MMNLAIRDSFSTPSIQTNIDINEPWDNDIWDLSQDIYKIYNPKNVTLSETLDFTVVQDTQLRKEFKIFLYERIQNRIITGKYVETKFKYINNILIFLRDKYPDCKSIQTINISKVLIEIKDYYQTNQYSAYKINYIIAAFKQVYEYWLDKYDLRDEYEKAIWDLRKINPSKVALAQRKYYLNFTIIPTQYRNVLKRYIKVCIQRYSAGYCERKIQNIRVFLKYIN